MLDRCVKDSNEHSISTDEVLDVVVGPSRDFSAETDHLNSPTSDASTDMREKQTSSERSAIPIDGAESEDEDDLDSVDTAWASVTPHLSRIMKSCHVFLLLYKKEGMKLQGTRAYYEIPIIVLSAVNSVFIAGGEAFLSAHIVKAMTIVVSLLIGIIQGLRTFMKVDETAEQCITTYRDLFRIYENISAVLTNTHNHRGVEPEKFLYDTRSSYIQCIDNSVPLPGGKTNPIYLDADLAP